MIIAIDGPVASGKSTISKYLSNKLNYFYIDTGAMYRAVTYLILINKLNLNSNKKEIIKLIEKTKFDFSKNGILINNILFEKNIRTSFITNNVSNIASNKFIRNILLTKQHIIIAKKENIIIEGRDIATIVCPKADLKIYLDTNHKKRLERRYEELKIIEKNININKLEKDIEIRDFKDINRKISPLKKTKDAYLINTDNLSILEVSEIIENLLKKKINKI